MKKYLILLPLIITLGGLFFLNVAFNKLQAERLTIKEALINNIGDRLINILDNVPDLTEEQKLKIIVSAVEFHDGNYYRVYAAAYNDMQLITERHTQDTPTVLDPLKYPEFINKISVLKKGKLDIVHDGMAFKIEFTWITDDILVVSGVTNSSIIDFSPWILGGMVSIFVAIIVTQTIVTFYVVNIRRRHENCGVCNNGEF